MSTGDDGVSSGINGRLRPRKSYISSLQTIKTTRRLDTKTQEKSKRVTTPSKSLLNKPDDLSKKSDCTSVIDFLCPYCDKSFVSKQAASKHARRIHFSTSKQDTFINCLYCNQTEAEPNDIVRHMIDSHPNQYFACLDCHTRFPSTTELAEHKLNVCERQKLPYRSKLRKKSNRTNKKSHNIERQVIIREEDRHGYNGIVISCELKPTHVHDAADIEDNITTNLILPPSKNLANKVIDKNAVIVLDDLQWNKRISHNFSFHNTDADQILSRLGVVHRSPRTGESTRKDWFKAIDDASQKFERCFDTSFYSKVASNVQENLSKFLDGSFNFNPDPNHTIKTRKAKNSVPINTVEGFPILLSCEQYSRNLFDGYMPRAIAPKHKWKWDNLENEKNPFSADIIKRDSHINNCIVTLVSSLDIWTQLCMRRKFEEKFKITPVEKKTEKRNTIGKELKEILESRQLPTSTSHVSRSFASDTPTPVRDGLDFPSFLGLTPTVPKYEAQPAVLSGEWVRPRCYVCCACGAQTRDPRALSMHISTEHPNAQVQHYEIAGELLLNADILKHLYVPPSPVHNRTRPLRGYRECTKCNKSITLEDLHQHMLDCAGDMPAVRRRCRYRQFGVRKRRSRIPDNRIRKKIRKEIQRQNGRPRPKIRTEVGDAETIRKMLADLPAKRQRVMINPLNSSLRPRRKIVKQRNQLTLKRRSTEEPKNRKINPNTASSGSERPENNDPNKINKEENRSLKTSIKRVQNQVSRRSEIINKKNLTKTRRKTVRVTQITENIEHETDVPPNETQSIESSSNKVQIEQLSIQNMPNKVDVNTGPYNTREQANRSNNNGSNNRDNQNPERNDHNGNSRDQGAPPQNIPLKHSIARLTADYDTQDKAVQFHHLFLVQQECNNVTQHVPSGQPVLFENSTVATKLDKPPLNINQKDEPLDNQNAQKGKSSKPRKGLNDCIAMLKNKLVEPNDRLISTAPNVSIQCRIDEPMKPPQQVHKTTVNSNRIDITIQCPDTESSGTDTIITPRRRQSINEKSIEEQIANLPTIGEYIKQNPDLLIKHKVYESLNCDVQSIESKSQITSTKVFTSPNTRQSKPPKDIQTAPIKTPKSTKQGQVRDNIVGNAVKTKQPIKDGVETYTCSLEGRSNESSQAQTAPMPQSKHSIDSSLKAKTAVVLANVNSDNNKEKKVHYDKQNISNTVAGLHISQDIIQKTDVTNLPSEKTKSKKDSTGVIPPAHSNTGVESVLTGPLDLSGKQYANDVTAHCSKQNITYDTRACENYETLDLSNKQVLHKENIVAAPIALNDEVVDLRIKHTTTTQTADSSLYSEGNGSGAVAATDLTVRNSEIDCTPTDLSIKGKTKITSIYDIRKEDIILTDTPYNPDNNANSVCLNLSAKNNEIPTDLSTKSICINAIKPTVRGPIESTIYKDSSSCVTSDKNKVINPADLSCRGKVDRQMSIFDCNVTHPSSECIANELNKTTRKSTFTNSLQHTNKERSVYDIHEQHLNSSGNSHFNLKVTDTAPKRPFMSSADVTISLMNKHNTLSQSANKHINLDNDEVNNINKGLYLLGNVQPIVTSHPHEATNLGFTSNSGIPLTRRNSENPMISPLPTRVAKTITNSEISLVSSSKVMHESSATTNLYSAISDSPNIIPPESAPSIPSTSYTDKQKALEKNIVGYNTKCAPTIEPVKLVEIKDKVITSSLEQDPETAKKIAMLPKELVEILGNMPVDHRNQLLNVLPQYVSTSPTPNIKSQNDEFKGDSLSYSNLSQYPYSGTDSFQLQHSTVNYIKSRNIKNSTDSVMDGAQLPGRVEKNENRFKRNDPTVKQRSSDSYLIEDRIIDLTDDKVDTSQTLCLDKENKTSCVSLKPVPPKTNNEKTASLRAVRIKAPSERHKSVVTETHFKKTYQENNNTIKLNNPDKKSKDAVGPLAVQQFEISTTEEAKGLNTHSPVSLPSVKEDFNVKNKREIMNSSESNTTDLNLEDDNATKTCCTSSTMVENFKLVNDISKNPVAPDIPPSKSEIIIEDGSKQLQPTLSNTEINSFRETHAEPQVNDVCDEDDSEDDVSLAIIVKQKLRDQELQSCEIKEAEIIVKEKSDGHKVDNNKNESLTNNVSENNINTVSDSINTESSINTDVANQETKGRHSKEKDKKIKRSRRNINATMIKVVNENLAKNKYESDVNKENAVLCDDTNVTKPDECEEKCVENTLEKLNNFDENLPNENDGSTITHDSKEKVKLKEKAELAQDANQMLNSEKNNQQMDEGNSNYIENEIKMTNKQSYSSNCKLSTGETNFVSKTVEVKNSEGQNFVKRLPPNTLETPSVKKLTNLARDVSGLVTCSEGSLKEKQTSSDSNKTLTNNLLSVNLLSLQKDKVPTPLRRSRRGKSLFIDNIDISDDLKEQNDNGADNRGPITKKQLIFSKLLLDGDKSNDEISKIENDSAHQEGRNENQSNVSYSILAKSVIIDSEDRNLSFANKSCKRKKSPMIKKKLKRKKSSEKVEYAGEDSKKSQNVEEIKVNDRHISLKDSITLETNVDTEKILVERNILSNTVIDDQHFEKSEDKIDVIEKSPKASTVKRKSNYSSNNDNLNSSIPKKLKSTVDSEAKDPFVKNDIKDMECKETLGKVETIKSGAKLAARRGRSKSVFVKSSVPDLYDPYDINLEDMVSETVPFPKLVSSLKHPTGKEINNCSIIEQIENNVESDTQSINIMNNLKTSKKSDTNVQIESVVETKGVMSDSDDSSKSDIPLKKYVQDKERKKLEVKVQDKNLEESIKTGPRKRNKQTLSVYSDKLDGAICRDENEERIRSEQFMESFGFFSERKPRKSNLLATKKISETFHIIANEKDDTFIQSKDKSNNKKGMQFESRKSADDEGNLRESISSSIKKVSKRGRKKKISTKIEPSFCDVCRKEFHRPDNFLRHQMTLAHVTRVSEADSKVKIDPFRMDGSNYLVIYKRQLDRLRVLQDKITRRKKYCKPLEKIALPTLEDIIADVTTTVKEQQLARRGLSRDEALFLDCCELLNASHKDDGTGRPKPSQRCENNCFTCSGASIECLNLLEKRINETLEGKCDDGDVDSITAQDILESEEVRNLENDLITGLKEAACANTFTANSISSAYASETAVVTEELDKDVSKSSVPEIQAEDTKAKNKKVFEIKEKMYPDIIENIDMFEDKFDKIKRKCRSQAAKQTQYVETSTSHKSRKKVDRKKRKKSPKKSLHSSVPTKGALKGFDGVKVSISTSEIDMSSILPPSAGPLRKKKRGTSKRKRDRSYSDVSRCDTDNKIKEDPQSKLDVYEFMDNEDAELFEFRPSTLMERFKSIGNKDMPSTSKSQAPYNDQEVSSESGSDGDDFVYMSDDYVCSDAETENSLMSCEFGNVKGVPESKKPFTPPKRKETAEKNAVMGKIFKHNAVRTEKKVVKSKDHVKPKANLDQLFDSLLEEEPNSSILEKNSPSPGHENYDEFNLDSPLAEEKAKSRSKLDSKSTSMRCYDDQSVDDSYTESVRKGIRTPSPIPYTTLIASSKKRSSVTPTRKIRSSIDENRPSTSKVHEVKKMDKEKYHKKSSHRKKSGSYNESDNNMPKRRNTYSPNYDDDSLLRVDVSIPQSDDSFHYNKRKSKEKEFKNKPMSSDKSINNSKLEYSDGIFDNTEDAGVARQRARRKCTVGKQNVLAETWSSESEPDGIPPRPNSADSVVVGLGRKKKGRKKEGQALGGRKANNRQALGKKHEVADSIRSNRNSCDNYNRVVPTTRPSAVGVASKKVRPRPPPYYWSDDEEEQEHVQQHGWIVGDSHKKLVTMLAHAKGKRNHDDKRHLVE